MGIACTPLASHRPGPGVAGERSPPAACRHSRRLCAVASIRRSRTPVPSCGSRYPRPRCAWRCPARSATCVSAARRPISVGVIIDGAVLQEPATRTRRSSRTVRFILAHPDGHGHPRHAHAREQPTRAADGLDGKAGGQPDEHDPPATSFSRREAFGLVGSMVPIRPDSSAIVESTSSPSTTNTSPSSSRPSERGARRRPPRRPRGPSRRTRRPAAPVRRSGSGARTGEPCRARPC
jgi:hypothetical protein